MADWEINKAMGRCCGTDKEIEPEEDYFAALMETDEGLQRRDFCCEYWLEHKPDVYCFWKSRLPNPESKKNIFIDDDMLMAFFERLAGESDPEKINFRFVLTLILMRKRKLKYESSTDTGGKEIWKLKITGSQDFAEVENPHLSEEQIEQLSGQVGQILQVDLE